MSGQIPYPPDYDLEAEIADARYRRALARVTVYDVLAVTNDLLSERDPREHPLRFIAAKVLRDGSYRISGKRAHFVDALSAAFEDLCDEAVARLVQEELAADDRADMALDLE
jgi:hypothetical protein